MMSTKNSKLLVKVRPIVNRMHKIILKNNYKYFLINQTKVKKKLLHLR